MLSPFKPSPLKVKRAIVLMMPPLNSIRQVSRPQFAQIFWEYRPYADSLQQRLSIIADALAAHSAIVEDIFVKQEWRVEAQKLWKFR